MIEAVMFLGLGFLVASLFWLSLVPLVHARAVRLTTRRVQAALPISLEELQAEKDRLRAEFAVATRRLELTIDELREKEASHLAELGRRTSEIAKLKTEFTEKTAVAASVEAEQEGIKKQLNEAQEQLAAKTSALKEAELKLAEQETEVARLSRELSNRSVVGDSQRIEIAALKTQIDNLRDQIADAQRQASAASAARAAAAAPAATAQNGQDSSGQAQDASQDRDRLRTELVAAQRVELELREQLATLTRRQHSALDAIRAEKTALEAQLEQARAEQAALHREMMVLREQLEVSSRSERVENEALRERINDVAAEVVRLTAALEGESSPITTILAGEHGRNGGKAPHGETPKESPSLAERIRVLQARSAPASRAS